MTALTPSFALTALMLAASNVFMTFAWYGHLKHLQAKPWYVAALVSWGIALFEYLLQVPANRIGFAVLSLGQLKILQEVITLAVFVPVRDALHGRAAEAGLPVGGAVPAGRGVLHFHSGRDRRRTCTSTSSASAALSWAASRRSRSARPSVTGCDAKCIRR